jgi:hypothetical protein
MVTDQRASSSGSLQSMTSWNRGGIVSHRLSSGPGAGKYATKEGRVNRQTARCRGSRVIRHRAGDGL